MRERIPYYIQLEKEKEKRIMCLRRCKALHLNYKRRCIGLRYYTSSTLFSHVLLGVHECTYLNTNTSTLFFTPVDQ